MILHAAHKPPDQVWEVVDLDTARRVPRVIWLDPEKGELEAYQVDEHGRGVRDGNGDFLTYKARGRFQFRVGAAGHHAGPEQRRGGSVPVRGAPACARCASPLTLPDRELCALCNAHDKGVRGFRVERLTTPILDRPCQHCRGRLATYAVSDEVEATAQVGAIAGRKYLFPRAQVVRQRYYCAWCYQAPRLLDAKGEIITVFEEAGGVRPQ